MDAGRWRRPVRSVGSGRSPAESHPAERMLPRRRAFEQPQVGRELAAGVDDALSIWRRAQANGGTEVASRLEVTAHVANDLVSAGRDVDRKEQQALLLAAQ